MTCLKTNDVFISEVFAKSEKIIKKRKKAFTAIIGFSAAVVVSVTAAALPAVRNNVKSENNLETQPAAAEVTEYQNEKAEYGSVEILENEEGAAECATEAELPDLLTETEKGEEKTSTKEMEIKEESFGGSGYFTLGRKHCEGSISQVGEILTAQEAEEYIRTNKTAIVTPIAFDSAYGGGEYRICTRGYAHITVKEDGTKELARNFLTFPITKNNVIIGEVTLMKIGGKISDSVAYGGNGFKKLTEILNENPGSELVFAYLNEAPEVIVTPENKVYFNPQQTGYESGADYYSAFRTDYNTFSKARLDDRSGYVTVNM